MAGSRRTERVSKELLRLLGGLLLELRDERLSAAMATPTRTRISADMSVLDVWVSVNGPEPVQLEILALLERARPFLRRRLAEEGGLRITPQLRFFRDEVPDHAARIAALLEEVKRTRPAGGEERPGPGADDDEGSLAGQDDDGADDGDEGDGLAGPGAAAGDDEEAGGAVPAGAVGGDDAADEDPEGLREEPGRRGDG